MNESSPARSPARSVCRTFHSLCSSRLVIAIFPDTLRAGDLAGELSFMDGEPRYASLIASGPTRVLVLDRPRFEELLQTHPIVVYKAMRAIMRVAHHVQRRLSLQMVDMQHYLYRTGGKY